MRTEIRKQNITLFILRWEPACQVSQIIHSAHVYKGTANTDFEVTSKFWLGKCTNTDSANREDKVYSVLMIFLSLCCKFGIYVCYLHRAQAPWRPQPCLDHSFSPPPSPPVPGPLHNGLQSSEEASASVCFANSQGRGIPGEDLWALQRVSMFFSSLFLWPASLSLLGDRKFP